MTLDKLIASVTNYLTREEVINNKNTVAYYILDDWEASNDPGGARSVLEKVHELIKAANIKYNLNRKTICYFAAWMAKKGETNYTGIGKNAYNFTSKGCDYIAINSYATKSYGGSTSNDDYDWDMNFLPKVKNQLMNQPDPYEDWDPNKTPFIGGVQTFGNDPFIPPTGDQFVVLPRKDDVKRQAVGFCNQGAIGIWFWPWQNYTGGGGNKYVGPETNSELFQGVVDGIAACNSYWNNTYPLPGDANGDRKVDGVDYVIWLNHYNQNTNDGPKDGDFNKDTKVDGLDYVVWLSNQTN